LCDCPSNQQGPKYVKSSLSKKCQSYDILSKQIEKRESKNRNNEVKNKNVYPIKFYIQSIHLHDLN
jgi:hypothetical protein